MTQETYEFDPHATNDDNYISVESHTVPTVDKAPTLANGVKDRVIIPKVAPFYHKDLVIKHNNKTLVEGTDYYLCFKYGRGSHVTAKQLYGGIWLINPQLGSGTVKVACRTLGGQYIMDTTRTASFLANDLVSLQNDNWEDVMGEDLFFPYVDVGYDLAAYNNSVTLSDVLDDLTNTIITKDPKGGELYTLTNAWFTALKTAINLTPYQSHINDHNNPHGVEWFDADALHKNGVAANANKVAGKTLAALTSYINANDIDADYLKQYINRDGDRTILGDLVFKDGMMSITWLNGTGGIGASISIGKNGRMHSNYNGVIHANANTSGTAAVTIRSGSNELVVTSTNSGLDQDGLTYNGHPIIHEGNLSDKTNDVSDVRMDLSVADSPTLSITHNTSTNVLTMDANVPDASETVYGIAQLSDSLTEGAKDKAATANTVKLLNDEVNTKLPTSTKVNGHTLDNDITLHADDFGLENVANVSDMDLPVNANHTSEVANKATGDHTHDYTVFGVPNGSLTTKGLIKYTNDYNSTSDEVAITSAGVIELKRVLDETGGDVSGLLPDDVIDITQYGGDNYLPVPVQGSYEASGPNRYLYGMGAFIEGNGKLVTLRNGADVTTTGAFYGYADISDTGIIGDFTTTATRYTPVFLNDDEKIDYIGRNTETAMLAVKTDSEGNEALVFILLNATFDSKYHEGCTVDIDLPIDENVARFWPFVSEDRCYIMAMRLYDDTTDKAGYIVMSLYSVLTTTVKAGGVVTFYKNILTGTDMWGDAVQGRDIPLIPTNRVSSADEKGGIYTEGSVYNRNLCHSSKMFTGISVQGDVCRVLYGSRCIVQDAVGNRYQTWGTSVDIDLAQNDYKVAEENIFPIVHSSDRVFSGGAMCNVDQITNSITASREGGIYEQGELNLIVVGHNAWPSYITSETNESGLSRYENFSILNRKVLWADKTTPEMNFGSVSEAYPTSVGVYPGNRIVLSQRSIDNIICVYDPDGSYGTTLEYGKIDGWGATTDRQVISSNLMTRYARTVTASDQGSELSWGGVILQTGASTAYIDPEDDSTIVQVADSILSDISAEIITALDVVVSRDTSLSILIPTDPNLPPLFHFTYLIEHSSDNNADGYIALFEGTVNKRSGTITSITLGNKISSVRVSTTAVRVMTPRSEVASSSLLKLDGDTYCYLFNNVAKLQWLSWNEYKAVAVLYDTATGKWSDQRTRYYDDNNVAEGYLVIPGVGMVNTVTDASATAIIGKVVGVTKSEYLANKQETAFLIHSSQVSEGWDIYFTQEVNYFINSTLFTMPKTGMNVKALYPNSYANNLFYLYASIVDGSPEYVLSDVYIVDSSTSTFIGTCYTGSDQITELAVSTVTRLGSFREFTEHLNSTTAHGIDVTNITADDIGLSLVENLDMKSDLIIPSFEDVYNNWYRLSHSSTRVYPAKESELDTWQYNAENDAIENTTNSSTLVGMVSDTKVGNYDFITGVSSTNADDDWIGVIIAFAIDEDGVEHTLSVFATGSDTHSIHATIVYNMAQGTDPAGKSSQITIKQFATTLKHGWNVIPERIITINRRGTVFNVGMSIFMDQVDSVIDYSFDCDDYPELAVFNGAVRFGYCAMSQAYSTWRNILRPDEDVSNYYASMKLLKDNFSWSERISVISGTAANLVKSGDIATQLIPYPEGGNANNTHVWPTLKYFKDSFGGVKQLAITYDKQEDGILLSINVAAGVGPVSNVELAYTAICYNDIRLYTN